MKKQLTEYQKIARQATIEAIKDVSIATGLFILVTVITFSFGGF